jgi:hypothetical protein
MHLFESILLLLVGGGLTLLSTSLTLKSQNKAQLEAENLRYKNQVELEVRQKKHMALEKLIHLIFTGFDKWQQEMKGILFGKNFDYLPLSPAGEIEVTIRTFFPELLNTFTVYNVAISTYSSQMLNAMMKFRGEKIPTQEQEALNNSYSIFLNARAKFADEITKISPTLLNL